jgi:hypothetical protein
MTAHSTAQSTEIKTHTTKMAMHKTFTIMALRLQLAHYPPRNGTSYRILLFISAAKSGTPGENIRKLGGTAR